MAEHRQRKHNHLLVLGGSGPSGIAFINAALRESYKLTLYLRNPSKLPEAITANPLVTVIKGRLDDEAGLEQAVSGGATALVSFLGPIVPSWGKDTGPSITQGYELLVPLLARHNIRRALILSTPSYTHPATDKWTIRWYLIIGLLSIFFNAAYRDVVSWSRYIAAQPLEDLKWTLFRVPGLQAGTVAGPVVTVNKGEDHWRWYLERVSLAEWVLNEVEADRFVGQAPLVYNA